MSINYAILGILSCRPLTGYDLKKIIQESSFMHWSGNNNQIYKALVELLDEGQVTSQVYHQESSPSKKIYTITEQGLAALKGWVMSTPEAPEYKKSFLIRLAWADLLKDDELDTLLTEYENEIKMQILMQQEKGRRSSFSPGRTKRESFLWDMIYENVLSSYKNELSWVQKLREGLSIDKKESDKMNFKVIERDNKKYIEFISDGKQLLIEQDVLDLITVCFEDDIWQIMLQGEMLTDDFFKLRTGLAGQVVQKFANYQIKAAIVLSDQERIKGRFKEFMSESNKGNVFRIFNTISEAENWLLL